MSENKLEMLYKCVCGHERLIHIVDAMKLRRCAECGQVSQMPALEQFKKHLELIQRSHKAFIEDEAIDRPSLPTEKFLEMAKSVKFACLKRHICRECLCHYDAYAGGEVEGFCPDCNYKVTQRVTRKLQLHAPHTVHADHGAPHHAVAVPANSELASPLWDRVVQEWLQLFIGLAVGFALGGLAAFSTVWV